MPSEITGMNLLYRRLAEGRLLTFIVTPLLVGLVSAYGYWLVNRAKRDEAQYD